MFGLADCIALGHLLFIARCSKGGIPIEVGVLLPLPDLLLYRISACGVDKAPPFLALKRLFHSTKRLFNPGPRSKIAYSCFEMS